MSKIKNILPDNLISINFGIDTTEEVEESCKREHPIFHHLKDESIISHDFLKSQYLKLFRYKLNYKNSYFLNKMHRITDIPVTKSSEFFQPIKSNLLFRSSSLSIYNKLVHEWSDCKSRFICLKQKDILYDEFLMPKIEILHDIMAQDIDNISSLKVDNEYVITGEDAQKIYKNLENPDKERVEIRRRTLKRAKEIYNKYKDEL